MSARDEFPRVNGETNSDQWADMCDHIDALRDDLVACVLKDIVMSSLRNS